VLLRLVVLRVSHAHKHTSGGVSHRRVVRCGRKQECRGLGGWVLARTSAPLLLQSLLLLLLMQSLPLQSLLLPHRRRRHRPANFRPAVIDLCAHKVRITGGGLPERISQETA
jgi:hypothetical protein